MKFIQVNSLKNGLKWHAEGCRDLKKSHNSDQDEPDTFNSWEEYINEFCSHYIDPSAETPMTMDEAIAYVKKEYFCLCAIKVLSK